MGESKEGWIFLGNVSLKLFFLGGFYEIDLIALTIRTGQKCSSQCISVFQNIFWVFHLAIRFDTLVVVKEQWLWTNVWVFTVECKTLLCAALSIRASFLPMHLDVQKKKKCSACSNSRTIKIHPEKSQSSDLEGKRSAPFQIVQPHPLVIRIKTARVRVRVAYLQVNQLLSKRLLFFSKSNRISLLTYYLRETSG